MVPIGLASSYETNSWVFSFPISCLPVDYLNSLIFPSTKANGVITYYKVSSFTSLQKDGLLKTSLVLAFDELKALSTMLA